MMEYFRIKNWGKYQHYKDRNPPWIKLHVEIFQSTEWVMAPSDNARLLIITVMILAARHDNKIPNDSAYIKKVAFLDVEPDIEWLLECEFLEPWAEDKKWENPWPSRHISEAVKAEVWNRDNGQCTACAATENIEYDHIIPVSKGGIGLRDNIQLLCRSCNRKKRNKMTAAAQCVASATRDKILRSPEKSREETETEAEAEGENTRALAPDGLNFEAWQDYEKYRRESKLRKLKPQSIEKQQRWLIAQGDQEVQRNIVDNTIRNGYQGLFELNDNGSNNHGKRKSSTRKVADKLDDIAREYDQRKMGRGPV